jgi:hypothetical protein
MSNFSDLWEGFCIMVGMNLVGLILAMFGGLVLDYIFDIMYDAGFLDYTDPAMAAWDSSSQTYLAMNVFYGIAMLFSIFGIAIFVRRVIRRQGYDQYVMQ